MAGKTKTNAVLLVDLGPQRNYIIISPRALGGRSHTQSFAVMHYQLHVRLTMTRASGFAIEIHAVFRIIIMLIDYQ